MGSVTLSSILFLVIITLIVIVFGQNPIDKCPPLPQRNYPTNVNDLTPADIRVVLALGDSISAAFGADGLDGGLDEIRGKSFSIGGDNNSLTVPRFISHYNPSVYGASIGSHFVEFMPGTSPYYDSDFLNAAQSNADSGDLHLQILHLVNKLSTAPINITYDWKLLTILISANDGCDNCDSSGQTPVDQVVNDFVKHFTAAIELIYEKMPRTLVNVVLQFNTSLVYELADNFTYCYDFHKVMVFECPCAFLDDPNKREYLDVVLTLIRQKTTEIANDWQAKNLPEFNVVVQPFTTGVNASGFDITNLSSLDCFHPSTKSHREFAIATWNSLLTPKKDKLYYFDNSIPLKCPTPTDRLG